MSVERIVPGSNAWDAFYANHIFRYQFAAKILVPYAKGRLLDAACGVGYGADYLSRQQGVEKVVAIDNADEALSIAKKQFASGGVLFLQDDCHAMQVASLHGPYDALVSFETLEHLPQPEKFLSSCFHNLKPGGKIIISTPNRLVSSPEELTWEFHEKEYSASEFVQMLETAGFRDIILYGQKHSLKGLIKSEVRADLNRLFSNPFVRIGRFLQTLFRGVKYPPVLKETLDDFEMVHFSSPSECEEQRRDGPFVLVALADKPVA